MSKPNQESEMDKTPRMEPEKPTVITKELIKADVVDRNGDSFPQATLEAMVKEANAKILANKDLWATEGFRRDTASIQGRVTSVGWNEENNAVDAEVEVYSTPPGAAVLDIMEKAGEDQFELALAGTLDEKDVTVEMRDGVEVRVIHKAELTEVSFVPKGTKVK